MFETTITVSSAEYLQVPNDYPLLQNSLKAGRMDFNTKSKVEWILIQKATYRAKTSPDRTQPIIVPRCGILFTYGSADDINTLRSPGTGNLQKGRFTISFSDIIFSYWLFCFNPHVW
jgi:hypothetical protein